MIEMRYAQYVSQRRMNFLLWDEGHDGKKPEVFSLADRYDRSDGIHMEDNACIAGEDGEYLVFVSTKDPAKRRRQPWTVVYRTNLITGTTDRLTLSRK
ncbi:hypothetical protein AgCh_035835 [Apium graveolens]